MMNLSAIIPLLEKHRVETAYVFGSVLTDRFDEESDLDLLITFKDVPLEEYSDNYFGLKFSLEEMLGREVDLLEEKALKNPYFIEEINKSKMLIYGQRNQSMAV